MEKRIYYHDTDSGGVVYYANYLKYLEEARTEYLEQRGISIKYMHDNNFLYAVRYCAVHYKSPARYGDTIVSDARIEKLTAAQMFFKQTVTEKSSGRILAEADVTLVSLNSAFKPCAIPEDIRTQLL